MTGVKRKKWQMTIVGISILTQDNTIKYWVRKKNQSEEMR